MKPFTCDELEALGVPLDERCWIVWDRAPLPAKLKECAIKDSHWDDQEIDRITKTV